MKKCFFLYLLIIFLSGCATYKFQQGKVPFDKGIVASRDSYTILEYTVGKNDSVPDLAQAKERFRRRKSTVEHYYKKMGYIENHFKMAFWNPVIYSFKVLGGLFRLPAIAISDYRYEHNQQYRERARLKEQNRDAREETRIKNLKEELSIYVQQDLQKEGN